MTITSNKHIPTAVLTLLQPYLNAKNSLYRKDDTDSNWLVRFVDTDPKSDFFFEITRHNVDVQGTITFQIANKPQSTHSIEIGKETIHCNSLNERFNNWVALLDSYTKLRGPFDQDPILNQYKEEFVAEFQILNSDADIAAFSYDQQERIYGFLEAINERLEQTKNEINKAEIEDIQQDIEELQEKQTRLTKRKVIDSLGKIVAKCKKFSFQCGKWAIETFIKTFAETIAKKLLDPTSLSTPK